MLLEAVIIPGKAKKNSAVAPIASIIKMGNGHFVLAVVSPIRVELKLLN